MIYLDNAATTYPKSERFYQALDQINRNYAVNAGRGSYEVAQNAMNIIENTRSLMKSLVHADESYETIFTPSATFAMNQLLFGMEWEKGDVVIVSPYEHNSVMRPLEKLAKRKGIVIHQMPVADDLEIDLEQLDYQFSVEQPRCVIASAVSNVTGYILPIHPISNLAKEHNSVVIIDASQAAGLIPLSLNEIKADALVWAGHKTLYGPFGIGGYVAKKSYLETLDEYLIGGTGSDSLNLDMPEDPVSRLEAGSHNMPAIATLADSLEELKEMTGDFDSSVMQIQVREQELTRYLQEQLFTIDSLRFYPEKRNEKNYVGIASIGLGEYAAEDIGEILDEDFGIAVRTGYHCAPLIHEHLQSIESGGTVRVSLGRFNTKEDVDALVSALKEIA